MTHPPRAIALAALEALESLSDAIEALGPLRLAALCQLAHQAEALLEVLRQAAPIQPLLEQELGAVADHLEALAAERTTLEALLECGDQAEEARGAATRVRRLRHDVPALRELACALETEIDAEEGRGEALGEERGVLLRLVAETLTLAALAELGVEPLD